MLLPDEIKHNLCRMKTKVNLHLLSECCKNNKQVHKFWEEIVASNQGVIWSISAAYADVKACTSMRLGKMGAVISLHH